MDGQGAGESMEREPTDTGLDCLVQIARYHQIAADAGQIAHAHGTSSAFAADDLVIAGRRLGLKIALVRSAWKRLGRTPVPAIAQWSDGSFVVVAGIRDDRVLVRDPRRSGLQALGREEFMASWSGTLLLVTRRSASLAGAGRFGFGWFIPAIVKHRKLFYEVLAA